MIGRPLRRNGLSGLNGLMAAADADFHAPLAVIPQFVVKSREMWCEMRELRMGHTRRISHSEF